jgi:general secretion pathway protein A
MGMLLARWGLNLPDLGTDTCTRLPAYGLRCERDRGTWRQLYALDRPVLLRLQVASGSGLRAGEGYLLLSGMTDDQVILSGPEVRYRMPKARLKRLLTGEYILVWQPPPVGGALIGAGSSGESVRWLRTLLSKIPDLGVRDTESGNFDAALGSALRRFQVKYGLNPDGIAGPKTLVQLNNAAAMPGIPRLSDGG